MDCASPSLNQYEAQLYSVFKTFDVDNEEALNKAAVLALCDALQLEERGAALADSLFARRRAPARDQRVTFAQFRSGLLAVLGDPPPASPPSKEPPPHSDDDSSGREVAPKFVVGSKKYGRRSRPPRASSAPDEAPPPAAPDPSRRMRCKRSASAMDTRDDGGASPAPPDLDHDSCIDCERALSLCRHLRMDGIDRRLIERIFETVPTTEITVGDFFDRLNASLTSIAGTSEATAVAEADDDEYDDNDATGDALPNELVVEAWERAGVQRPRRLLTELGFEGAALRAPDLERALDEELRALVEPPDARALLLLAALALSRLRHRKARRCAVDAAAERDRLRADVTESNRRAQLLAQEVDENHVRLEAELTANLRRAEARHAEASRAAEAERVAERERLAGERAALEAEISRRVEAEARLRGEAGMLRQRAQELEARAAVAEEHATVAERDRARLAGALRAAQEERVGTSPLGSEAGGALAARLEELRGENTRLRDRCDELCAELEQGARGAGAIAGGASLGASWCEEAGAAEPATPPHHHDTEECDSLPVSLEQRESQVTSPARVDSDTQTEPAGVEAGEGAGDAASDEKQKLTEVVKELETSLEQMRVEYERCEDYWNEKLSEERELFAEEQRASDERLAELVGKIAEYERQFTRSLPTIDEKYSLELQVTSLEEEFEVYKREKQAELSALREQLRGRQARLDELAARLRASEDTPPARSASLTGVSKKGSPPPAPRRSASAGATPPAAPACAAPACAAPACAAPGAQLLRQARPDAGRCECPCATRVAELSVRLARVQGAHAREAAALRARLARADAHAARLTSRLHAADLLVKDLYVENCMLGPLPHPHRL